MRLHTWAEPRPHTPVWLGPPMRVDILRMLQIRHPNTISVPQPAIKTGPWREPDWPAPAQR